MKFKKRKRRGRGVQSKKKVKFKIGNKVIRKNKQTSRTHTRLRQEALENRTDAELWAEEILSQNFDLDSFQVEQIFQFRRFDFYFQKVKIAVEIDGGYHKTFYQSNYDKQCDDYLWRDYKITVYRVQNFDEERLQFVVDEIRRAFCS